MSPKTFYFVALLVLALVGLGLWLWRRLIPPAKVPFGEMPVREVKFGDWSMRYHISGRGPYLVLIHGIGANLFCWRWLTPRLNSHYTVVAPDLPGFGQSSKPPGATYGLDDQVARLQDFFRALGIKNFYLVGNSMGGNIALWYALTHPHEVEGVAVIAPATSPALVPIMAAKLAWLSGPLSLMVSKGAMKWAHRRTVSKKHLVDSARISETYKTYGRNSAAVRSFLMATEAIRDPRLAHRLRELKSPLLILWGSRDRLVPRKVIDALEGAVVNHESHVHMGGGHHLQEDEPEWVSAKIDGFFQTSRD